MNETQLIGSVSHGTMREEDLIPCFLDMLDELNPNKAKAIREEYAGVIESLGDEELSEDAIEDACYLLNEVLFTELDACAMPYFYFGAHPGDGSDYGFWLSDDFQRNFEDDGGLTVSDLSEVPQFPDCAEVLLVNDHGNMTLFAVDGDKLTEVWSLV